MTTVTGRRVNNNPSPSSIQESTVFIRKLTIDYKSVLRLFSSIPTFPTLADLVVSQSIWGKPFYDPALADFIKQHRGRGTLQSITLAQHANDAVLAALEDCSRLDSLASLNQDHALDPSNWIHHFEQLWSRLHTMSLEDDDNLSPLQLVTGTAMNWPRSNGPNRIGNLSPSFHRPEAISGFCSWIVKQCPDLV